MGIWKRIGTPKKAKGTLKKIVKEEIDDKRNDGLAKRRKGKGKK